MSYHFMCWSLEIMDCVVSHPIVAQLLVNDTGHFVLNPVLHIYQNGDTLRAYL